MSNVEESTSRGLTLRPLDAELPLLAARAAIELDNLLGHRPTAGVAVGRLASRLEHFGANRPVGEMRSLIDAGTVTLVSRAVRYSQPTADVTTLDELVEIVRTITHHLRSTEDANPTLLIVTREFCLALARAASEYQRAILFTRPDHPLRK